jgi:hypothetical protein
MANIKKYNSHFALSFRFLSFYILQFLSPLTSKQLSISSCHSERNQDPEDIVNKIRVTKAAKCKILQLNAARQSISACPALKESKWSKWWNSTSINNWTLVMLSVLFHNYYFSTLVNLYGCVFENVCTYSFMYTAYHLRSEKQIIPLR